MLVRVDREAGAVYLELTSVPIEESEEVADGHWAGLRHGCPIPQYRRQFPGWRPRDLRREAGWISQNDYPDAG